MRELNKLKQELMIMKTNNFKPNYSELARLHKCDRRTVKNMIMAMRVNQLIGIKSQGWINIKKI